MSEISEGIPIVEAQPADMPHVRSDGYLNTYSNFVQCGRSAWDVSLVFGQLVEIEPGKAAVVERVNVVCTPAMAKALVGVLAQTVRIYEAENGEIQMPAIVSRAAEAIAAANEAAAETGVEKIEVPALSPD